MIIKTIMFTDPDEDGSVTWQIYLLPEQFSDQATVTRRDCLITVCNVIYCI